MKNVIACEGFELTPAIRDHVEQNIDSMADYLPHGEKIEVFLSHPAKRSFSALFKVHAKHREVVASEDDENLYKAITGARSHLERRLNDLREKELSKRRKGRTFEAVEDESESEMEDPISS